MNSKVYCFASAKGGSGKTVLTANIASFLTEIGKKCLIIDADAATHGMTLLYIVEVSANPNIKKQGVFEISNGKDISELLKSSLVSVENGVDLLPATYNFKAGFDPEDNFEVSALQNIVQEMRKKYDVILLDAQAGSDKYSKLAMKKDVSDEVIIVSEYDPLSAAGIERLKQVIGDDLDYTRTWILLNKILPEFADKFSEFLSITKYLPPIPWNADVVRSYAKRKLSIDLDKGNAFTLAIMRTVKTLWGKSIEDEINAWSKKRSYALKEPLEAQYRNAEKELDYTLKSLKDTELKAKKRKLINIYIYLLPITIVPFLLIGYVDSSITKDFLTFFKKFNIFPMLAAFIAVIIPPIIILAKRFFDTETTTESIRYKRRIEILEEKLKQLEALRSADLETLINSSEKIHNN